MKNFKFDSENKPSRKQRFYSEEDDYYYFRKHIRDCAEDIVKYLEQKPTSRVLEIGPAALLHKEDNYPELNTRIISEYCKNNNIHYKSLDIDPKSSADFIGSVEDLSFMSEKFDVVVMLSVLEHVENLFAVPEQLSNVSHSKAKLFINTPFMFKIHGPTPDCWRISEYGYKALFKNHYSIKDINTFPPNELGKNSLPLSMNLVLEKL